MRPKNNQAIFFKYFTFGRMAQLSADDLCLFRTECITTDGTPGIVNADLHSAFQLSNLTPSKPQFSMSTAGRRSNTEI